MQDTPMSAVDVDPVGFFGRSITQVEPFQDSARGSVFPALT
jgi:hypothetical protein